jgi:hypothetical protein
VFGALVFRDSIAQAKMLHKIQPSPSTYPICSACGQRTRLASVAADSNHPYRLPIARFACRCGRTTAMPWRPAAARPAIVNGAQGDQRRDYVVTAKSYGRTHSLWRWDIQRRSKPLGITFYDDGFETEQAAKFAGERALMVFLDGLRQEERVQSERVQPESVASAPARPRAVTGSTSCR